MPSMVPRASHASSMGNVRQVGDTGSTVVEESQTLGDEVDFTEGLTMDRGFLSPYFINDQERSLCEMKKPKVKDLVPVGGCW